MSYNSINASNGDKSRTYVLCYDISAYSQTTQFFICSSAVFVFFLLYGYILERIFTLSYLEPYAWYLTLVQFGCYTVFGLIEKHLSHTELRRTPLSTYFFLALLTVGTIGLSNVSLAYLNYPTQVIFKSCKLVPVLIGSILIQGKRYGPLDFIAAVLMCIGLTLFTLADSQISPKFDSRGVITISLALLCDAVIGNLQEKAMKTYNSSNSEVVLYSYGIGFFYILIVTYLTDDLYSGIKFFAYHPVETYGSALLLSISGYLGIQVVLTLVRTCGAFAAVTVTTCRKVISIIISFIFFTKPFTFQYVWSGLIIVLGVYLNLYSKRHPISLVDVEMKIKYYMQYFSKRSYVKFKEILYHMAFI